MSTELNPYRLTTEQLDLLKYIGGYNRINIALYPIWDEADTMARNLKSVWNAGVLMAGRLVKQSEEQPGDDGVWIEITPAGRSALESK